MRRQGTAESVARGSMDTGKSATGADRMDCRTVQKAVHQALHQAFAEADQVAQGSDAFESRSAWRFRPCA